MFDWFIDWFMHVFGVSLLPFGCAHVYCNSIPSNLPKLQLHQLQYFLSSDMANMPNYSHESKETLNWLPIAGHVTFKTLLLGMTSLAGSNQAMNRELMFQFRQVGDHNTLSPMYM